MSDELTWCNECCAYKPWTHKPEACSLRALICTALVRLHYRGFSPPSLWEIAESISRRSPAFRGYVRPEDRR